MFARAARGICMPCPANPSHVQAYKAAFARRSATLKVHSKGLTSLHTAGKGQPNPVEGTYATSPYDKSVTPHITDTNQVFLGRVD